MNVRRYFAQLGIARFIAAALLLIFAWFRFETIGAIIITTSVLGILLIIWLQFTLTRVRVNHGVIVQQGGFLPTKTLTISSLAPALYVVQYIEPGFGVFKRLLLLDTATGKKLNFSSLYWDEATVADIIKHLTESGAKVDTIKDPTTIQQLAKAHPKYLPLFIRRPYLSATFIVLAIAVLITIGVIVFQ